MAILTDTKARSIKPESPQLAHGGVPGLVLIPSATKGRGKWVLRFVSPLTGKRRNAGLGIYPEIGIAEAGKQASAMREKLAAGIDPLQAKVEAAAKPGIPSFKSAAETLHNELLPGWKSKKHGQQWLNTLSDYAFSVIGDLPLDRIQPKHIADVLRPIWLSKAETAGRVKQRLDAVFLWGWAHGHCSLNPVDGVDYLLPQQPSKAVRTQHQPAMPWRDIPTFVAEHLATDNPFDRCRPMLQLLILTAARSGEIRGMRWDEVDLENAVWTVPAERMKAKLPHRIPLSKQALQIIEQQQGNDEELVFPSPRDGVVLSDMALTSLLRKIKPPSDVQGRIATAHGFRSSFRDWCSERSYPRDLAERALAHTVSNKVEAAYHRTDLLDQRRPMMQAWADYCSSEIKTKSEAGTLADQFANIPQAFFDKK